MLKNLCHYSPNTIIIVANSRMFCIFDATDPKSLLFSLNSSNNFWQLEDILCGVVYNRKT